MSIIVIYNSSGKNIASCVLQKDNLPEFPVSHTSIAARGFIADKKTHFFGTNSEFEAHYLCAILNSDPLNQAIKPLQTKGLLGERDIGRRPFSFPIPKYDKKNPIHKTLAQLSIECHCQINDFIVGHQNIGLIRKHCKAKIADKLEQINESVSQFLLAE